MVVISFPLCWRQSADEEPGQAPQPRFNVVDLPQLSNTEAIGQVSVGGEEQVSRRFLAVVEAELAFRDAFLENAHQDFLLDFKLALATSEVGRADGFEQLVQALPIVGYGADPGHHPLDQHALEPLFSRERLGLCRDGPHLGLRRLHHSAIDESPTSSLLEKYK